MDSKYDKIKKVLGDDKLPLPPEFAWENMEAGILQKMEELESQPRQPGSRNWVAYLGAGMLIVFVLLPLLCIQHAKNEVFAALTPANTGQDKNTYSERLAASGNGTLATVSTDTQDESASVSSENMDRDFSAGSDHFSIATTTSTPPGGIPAAGNIQRGTEGAASFSVPVVETTLPISAQPTDQPASSLYIPNGTDSLYLGKTAHTFAVLSELPLTYDLLLWERAIPLSKVESQIEHKASPLIKPYESKSGGRIVALGGMSIWSPGYGNNKPERHAYEQQLASGYAEVNYIHTLKRNYILMLGLQYHQLESRFDWNRTIEDYKLVLKDTIVEVNTSALTGQPSLVYGDIELTVRAQQVVRHYNTTRMLQVPVAVGKTWGNKNWQADVLIGGAATVWSQNEGLTLYQGELLTYSGSSNDIINTQLNVNGLLKGRLTYLLSDKLGVTTGAQFQKSLTNWSAENGFSMHPNILNFELGLSYYLK